MRRRSIRDEYIEGIGEVPYPHSSGTLLVVCGGLGIPSIVRVECDGSWRCVAGIFKGRPIRTDKKIVHVCEEGDVFEDLELVICGGELVPIGKER